MSVTPDTSHSSIGPYGLLEQSPCGDSFRNETTASSSSVVDCGENNLGVAKVFVGVGVHTIDPGEPENISFLLAFDWTQAAPQSFCLNDFAPSNMKSMSVALDTSHFEMSQLNTIADWNIAFMFFTFDTSHFDMAPLNAL